MDLDAKTADDLGNLYRAALMIGKGNTKMGEILLRRAGKHAEGIDKYENNLFWAEKILDEYYRIKWTAKN